MRSFGRFLRNIWYLMGPYLRSEEKWSAYGLLFLVLGADFLLVRVNLLLNLNSGGWFQALQQYDEPTFLRLMLTYQPNPDGPFGIVPGLVPILAVALLIFVNGRYLRQWLQIRWRRWLTAYYREKWLSNKAYYRIQLQPETLGNDNPDQRIADDIADLVESGLILGFGFLANLVSLVSFLLLLWALSFPITVFGIVIPAYFVWVALFYSIVGTILAQLIGRPLVSLNFIRQRLEADFRFALVRLRENAEGVALYKGEADEAHILGSRFAAIVANFRQIMSRNRLVNGFVYVFGQLAAIFPFFAAAPLYFSKKLTFGTLTRVAGAFSEVQSAASWVVDNYQSLANWAATVERLATFGRALDALQAAGPGGIATVPASGRNLAVRGLRLELPDHSVLLNDAAFGLAPGQSAAVSGPSGIGKSTLFRALAGVWPFGSGTVEQPPGSQTMFLPQKPYIPLGTLRRAVSYPSRIDAFPQAAVAAALNDVGLGRLVPELDVDTGWSQRLSGGEQQRLAVARALLNRPDFLFLDEATANLDPVAEAELYRAVRQRLPQTAVLSIVHRPELASQHDTVLRFEPGGQLVPDGVAAQEPAAAN